MDQYIAHNVLNPEVKGSSEGCYTLAKVEVKTILQQVNRKM